MSKYIILTREESKNLKAFKSITITRNNIELEISNGKVTNRIFKPTKYKVFCPTDNYKSVIILTHKESKELKDSGKVNINKWGYNFIITQDSNKNREVTILNPYYGYEVIERD